MNGRVLVLRYLGRGDKTWRKYLFYETDAEGGHS
jgi:hypothetical protein